MSKKVLAIMAKKSASLNEASLHAHATEIISIYAFNQTTESVIIDTGV